MDAVMSAPFQWHRARHDSLLDAQIAPSTNSHSALVHASTSSSLDITSLPYIRLSATRTVKHLSRSSYILRSTTSEAYDRELFAPSASQTLSAYLLVKMARSLLSVPFLSVIVTVLALMFGTELWLHDYIAAGLGERLFEASVKDVGSRLFETGLQKAKDCYNIDMFRLGHTAVLVLVSLLTSNN
jgi:hypothetical protein